MARETLKQIMSGVVFEGRPKIIANNTIRYMRPDGAEVVRLHHTDIVVKLKDGSFILDTGGWKTRTTKDRINAYSPARVYSLRGTWYVGGDEGFTFFDGMRVGPNGLPIGKPKPNVALKEQTLRKQIRDFVAKLDTLPELPQPSGGDCWICSMFQREPVATQGPRCVETTGPTHDNGHLLEHVKEGYMHGALIMNALAWAGYRDPGLIFHMANADLKRGQKPDMVKRSLRRYLYRKLGMQA